jgi:hypothetical protein
MERTMDFIHAEEHLDDGDVVVVDCDHQCNVMLMDDANFGRYRRGAGFDYYGGHYEYLPARIGVPHSGHWHTVIDLGGRSANIRYNISYLKCAA